MNILIYGIAGTMGKIVYNALKNHPTCKGVCGVDKYAKQENFDIPVYQNVNDVKEKIEDAEIKMQDREVLDTDMENIIVASTVISTIGGAVLGGVYGSGLADVFSGAFLGAGLGTIFLSLLMYVLYQTKPATKVVQGVRKYILGDML